MEDLSPFGGVTDTPVLDFWWHLLRVSKPVDPLHACFLACVILRFTSGATPADCIELWNIEEQKSIKREAILPTLLLLVDVSIPSGSEMECWACPTACHPTICTATSSFLWEFCSRNVFAGMKFLIYPKIGSFFFRFTLATSESRTRRSSRLKVWESKKSSTLFLPFFQYLRAFQQQVTKCGVRWNKVLYFSSHWAGNRND